MRGGTFKSFFEEHVLKIGWRLPIFTPGVRRGVDGIITNKKKF